MAMLMQRYLACWKCSMQWCHERGPEQRHGSSQGLACSLRRQRTLDVHERLHGCYKRGRPLCCWAIVVVLSMHVHPARGMFAHTSDEQWRLR